MIRDLAIIILIITIFLSASACVKQSAKPVYEKNGKLYGKPNGTYFRHRWWNYYERGFSYADGGFYADAIDDFLRAIEERDDDQRRARIYGFHFIDYFPHRELGIIYYSQNDLIKAKEELEKSISHYPSAKARFYIDKVRKALIVKKGGTVPPPVLLLDLADREVWTRNDSVEVSGIAKDENYIHRLQVSQRNIYIEGAQARIPFSEKISLPPGRHEIKISTSNLMDATTEKTIVFHVDWQGPLINIEKAEVFQGIQGQTVRLSGSAVDLAGLSSLSINGEAINTNKKEQIFFSYDITQAQDSITISASDKLGNLTETTIPMEVLIADASNTILIAQNDTPENKVGLISKLFQSDDDDTPPTIQIKGLTGAQTVYYNKVYIEGVAADQEMVSAIEINGMPLIKQKGKIVIFNEVIELKPGDNMILIQVWDEGGNRSEKSILVKYNPPKLALLSGRMSLSILSFSQDGQHSKKGKSFNAWLSEALLNQNRFRLVDRGALETILTEQDISASDLIDPKTALKVGRLVAANCVVSGYIIETSRGTEIVSKMIDTETSEILAMEDVYTEDQGIEAVHALATGTAVKFHLDFPTTDGLVIDKKGNFIFTDIGLEKVKKNKRLIVYREEEIKHPETGMVLGVDHQIIDSARITDVNEHLSKAVVVSKKGKMVVKNLDKVMTQ